MFIELPIETAKTEEIKAKEVTGVEPDWKTATIFVNVNHITLFWPESNGNSWITTVDGETTFIKLPLDQLENKIKEALNGIRSEIYSIN